MCLVSLSKIQSQLRGGNKTKDGVFFGASTEHIVTLLNYFCHSSLIIVLVVVFFQFSVAV